MSKAIIALGSNIEPRLTFLKQAIEEIKKIGKIDLTASIYESKAVGFESETDFLNSILILETIFFPNELLTKLKEIETKIGRVPKISKNYTSRVIDLDLIGFDNQVVITKRLTLPHPEFRNRRFVLEPLAEIHPEWRDPITQQTVLELLQLTKDKSQLSKNKSSLF